MQTLDPGTHTIIDPKETDIKYTPVIVGGQPHEYWYELGRWYIRRHGEESACAGPFRTPDALKAWTASPNRKYKSELPMSDDYKPINVRTFVTAVRTCHATAERICGITYSVVDDKHILRENGEDGFIIPDWPQFIESDTYATMVVRDFLNIRNHARMNEERNHHTRPASAPAPLGRVRYTNFWLDRRLAYLGAPDGYALAAHVIRYHLILDTVEHRLIIDRLRTTGWHNVRWQDKVKDYANDRGFDAGAAFVAFRARLWAEADRRSQAAPIIARVAIVKETDDAAQESAVIDFDAAVAAIVEQKSRPDALAPAAKWDNEGAIRLLDAMLEIYADPRRWNSARHEAEKLIAEAEGRYDWQTGEITPRTNEEAA